MTEEWRSECCVNPHLSFLTQVSAKEYKDIPERLPVVFWQRGVDVVPQEGEGLTAEGAEVVALGLQQCATVRLIFGQK